MVPGVAAAHDCSGFVDCYFDAILIALLILALVLLIVVLTPGGPALLLGLFRGLLVVGRGMVSFVRAVGQISIRVGRYQHGGGGFNIFRSGKRIFGLDYHKFKLAGKMVRRLHYHLGRTASQMAKHRPWQGGWWPRGGIF